MYRESKFLSWCRKLKIRKTANVKIKQLWKCHGLLKGRELTTSEWMRLIFPSHQSWAFLTDWLILSDRFISMSSPSPSSILLSPFTFSRRIWYALARSKVSWISEKQRAKFHYHQLCISELSVDLYRLSNTIRQSDHQRKLAKTIISFY